MEHRISYVKAQDDNSPRNRWRLHRVLHDGGEGGWSAAEGQWDNEGLWREVLAVRWNGSSGCEIGNPQSRGLPTWFILPDEMEQMVRESIGTLPKA